ncbi:MAG: hypothetical protein HYU05_01790 [Candidatus Wildermuthbacteria bacterium]|nr:hypothetical protein [Candidatus Wildermuthbacteria bacterium]
MEQRTPQRPRLSDLRESGCVTGDTRIVRADTGERIPIKTLAERTVQSPIPVFALGDDYTLQTRQMTKVFYSGKKKVFEMKTRSGRTIKASANHPLLRVDGWKRLDELHAGDHVALPRALQTNAAKNPMSQAELILLAHLLGDGCVLPRQPFHYTSADKENIETVGNAAKELFGIAGRVVPQKNWYHLYLPSPYRLTHGRHHPVTEWFGALEIPLVRSWEKRVPDRVFQCDQSSVALFLGHLWSTDGNVSWKRIPGRKSSGNIYYATSSPLLAEQVQHLLLRCGILSSLRVNTSKKQYRPMFHVSVEGAGEQLRFLETVGVIGKRGAIVHDMKRALKEIVRNTNVDVIPSLAWRCIIEPAKEAAGVSWREVSKRIDTAYCGSTLFQHGIGRARMMKLALGLRDQTARDLATSDVLWDRVVSITPLGVEDVYDATVEGVHNFVANDIVIHNSLEQDADVVLFIYREDKYAPESSTKNVAEIIIAKHRNGPVGSVKLFFNEATVSFSDLAKDADYGQGGYEGAQEPYPF